MRKRYRSIAGIIYDVLHCIENGADTVTSVSTCANLPYDRAKGIIERLIEKGFIEKSSSNRLYLTDKGKAVEKKLRELKDLMEALGFKL